MTTSFNTISDDVLSEILGNVSSYPKLKRVSKKFEKSYNEHSKLFKTKKDLMGKYPAVYNYPLNELYYEMKYDFNVASMNGDFEAIKLLLDVWIDRIASDNTYIKNTNERIKETQQAVILATKFPHFFGEKEYASEIVLSNKEILVNMNKYAPDTSLMNRYLFPNIYYEPVYGEVQTYLGYENYKKKDVSVDTGYIGAGTITVDASTYRNLTDEVCVNVSTNSISKEVRAVDTIKKNRNEDHLLDRMVREDVITKDMIDVAKELSIRFKSYMGKRPLVSVKHSDSSKYFILAMKPDYIDFYVYK